MRSLSKRRGLPRAVWDSKVCRTSNRKRASNLFAIATAGALGSALTHRAAAAVDTWTGATDTNWLDSNWTGGNNPPISGDSLVFGSQNTQGNTTLTDTLTSTSFSVAGITFNSGALAYTFGGSAFALAGGITNNSTAGETINNAIGLAATQTFTTTTGGGNLTLGGVISGNGSVNVAGSGTVTLSNASNTFTGGEVVSSGILSIAADGDLGAAPGSVTPTAITLNGGTLQVTATTSYGFGTINANRGITLGSAGGTIQVTAVANTGAIGGGNDNSVQYFGVISGSGNLTISGGPSTNSTSTPYLFELIAQSTYTGSTSISNAVVTILDHVPGPDSNILPPTTVLNIVNHGIYNFCTPESQVIAGLTSTGGDTTGSVTVTNGAAAVVLTIDPATGQTYTFNGTIGSATILNKTGTADQLSLMVNGGGTQILTGNNNVAGGMTVNGGTLDLLGTNAQQTGGAYTGVFANGGTLEADYTGGASSGTVLNSSNPLTLGGGTFNVNGNSTGNRSQTLANLNVNSGGSTLSVTNNGATSTSLVFTSGTFSPATGGTVDFVSPSGTSITLSGNNSTAFLGTHAYFGSGSSETYAATNSSGVVQAAAQTAESTSGVNGFTSASTNYAYTSPGTPDDQTIAAATANSVVFNTSGAQVIDIGSAGGANTLTLNGLLNVGGALTIQRTSGTGSLVVGSSNALVIGGSGTVTISTPIANDGSTASALTLSDTGTVNLSASSTYSGVTTINNGLVNVGIVANGSTASSLGQSSNANTNLVINGGTLQYTGSTAVSTDRLFTLGGGGATIDSSSTTQAATLTFSNTGALAYSSADAHAHWKPNQFQRGGG